MRLRQAPSRISAIPPRLIYAPKVTDDFYHSPEWRALAARIKRERGFVCAKCGVSFAHDRRRVIADHIIERRDGGADLDPANVQILCIDDHNAKTAAARSARMRSA